jgi:uncharacterized protein YdeI (YjbR/CyaY-like superfamily)
VPTAERATKPFKTQAAFEAWLAKHHADTDGLWVRFYKKASGVPTITYAEALEVALCYGWIDGQRKSLDAESFIQLYTPRRKRSLWSKINKGHVARLIESGRMQPAGLAEIERAKADGRWDQAYGNAKDIEMPADFLRALAKDKEAKAFFATLNKANIYAIAWRLATAKKPETRARRMAAILAWLAAGEPPHPQTAVREKKSAATVEKRLRRTTNR